MAINAANELLRPGEGSQQFFLQTDNGRSAALTEAIRRVWAAREGGHVRRCHVVQHLGHYDVAQHSYNALSLLLVLHPNPSLQLIKAVLWHDVGERWLGDMPSPAKAADETLCKIYEDLEARVLALRLGLDVSQLQPEERAWLRAVDTVELLMWCNEQLCLGSHVVAHWVSRLEKSLASNLVMLPPPVHEFLVANGATYRRLEESPLEIKA